MGYDVFAMHDIVVTRPEDTDGLGRSQGAEQTVYDGRADVQEQAVTQASSQGGVVRVGDAEGFLPEGVDMTIQAGDNATVTRPDGTTFEATVASVTRLDKSFVLSKDR
jgi:hypothetical protein